MLVAAATEVVPIRHQRMGCLDEDDDHLLEVAVAGKADYLVSEDRAVFAPPPYVRAYLERHGIRVGRGARGRGGAGAAERARGRDRFLSRLGSRSR